MRAAVRRRNGVAVGIEKSVGVGGPGHRPLHRALGAVLAVRPEKCPDAPASLRRASRDEIILQALVEMEGRLLRHVLDALDQRGIAGPADFDAAETDRPSCAPSCKALGREFDIGPEILRIGPEADPGAAPVERAAGSLQFAHRLAALEAILWRALFARHLHVHPFRQRIGHRGTYPMQATRGLIDFAVEFSAGMQRAHDHFQRRLVLEFGMRVDRDAAAIVGDARRSRSP